MQSLPRLCNHVAAVNIEDWIFGHLVKLLDCFSSKEIFVDAEVHRFSEKGKKYAALNRETKVFFRMSKKCPSDIPQFSKPRVLRKMLEG